jgi:hypothetical protein
MATSESTADGVNVDRESIAIESLARESNASESSASESAATESLATLSRAISGELLLVRLSASLQAPTRTAMRASAGKRQRRPTTVYKWFMTF